MQMKIVVVYDPEETGSTIASSHAIDGDETHIDYRNAVWECLHDIGRTGDADEIAESLENGVAHWLEETWCFDVANVTLTV